LDLTKVYILVLPAFGVYSEVVSTFSTKELYGYVSLVLATMAIAMLSFTVWVHHFLALVMLLLSFAAAVWLTRRFAPASAGSGIP
jgi:heme/copper-type cytochrome/quinol oxidase subunit 1